MKKQILKIQILMMALTATLMLMPFHIANAVGSEVNKDESIAAEIDGKGTCYASLPSEFKDGIANGRHISTEIEESLTGPGSEAQFEGAIIKTCFRVTACMRDDDNKSRCFSFLNDKCELTGENQSMAKKALAQEEASKNGDIDSENLRCSKMQLIVSPAGTGLFYTYIGLIYRWATSIIGIIAVLIIIVSGIQMSASGGDSSIVENARNRMIQAIAGLAVLFLSGLILYTINPTFFVK